MPSEARVTAGLAPRGPDLRGRILAERYRLGDLLAAGGMADIYDAHDLLLRRRVALKAIHPEHARTPNQRRRFFQEAVLGAQLDHPHVMPIFDRGEDHRAATEPVLFLVMPLIAGMNLRHLILEGPMPWRRAVGLTLQLLDGLAAIHDRGVLHRDLKPENCLVRARDGRDHLLLLDLGLAKIAGDERVLSIAPTSTAGSLVGTLSYLSPEQARDEPVTRASDLYSVGVILFELLTRRPPFSGGVYQVLSAHVGAPPPSPRVLAPSSPIPEGVEAIVLRALAKRPEERYGGARELAEALAAELAVEDPTAPEIVGRLCGASHAGTDEAQACLAAWTCFEPERARGLADEAVRRNRGWSPLRLLFDRQAEE